MLSLARRSESRTPNSIGLAVHWELWEAFIVLISQVRDSLKNDYFYVWEIAELLYSKTEGDWDDVAIYLGYYDFETQLSLYKHDYCYRVIEASDKTSIRKFIDLLNSFMPFDSEEETKAIISSAKVAVSMHLWRKKDIYNFQPIMDLGIIQNPKLHAVQEISNDKLKTELKKKDVEIELLKRKIQSFQQNDLLNQILDEQHPFYALDLARAIQLWKHAYIGATKEDSHTNKANLWIIKNTNYDINKSSGSRLREITTPLKDWNPQRTK